MVASFCLMLATGSTHFAGQPIFKVYRSVDVMALSGASMVGVAVRTEPPAPGGEQIKPCVLFRNCVAINWYGAFAETGAYLKVDPAKIDEWIRTKARILSFDGGDWVNLDDPSERFCDARLHRITDANEVVGRLRQVYADHPEIERVRVFYRPVSPAEAVRLGVELNTRIAVPLDGEVQRWAIEMTGSAEGNDRAVGASALLAFENAANKLRLKKLLTDPYMVSDLEGRNRYPVRDSARMVLERWGD